MVRGWLVRLTGALVLLAAGLVIASPEWAFANAGYSDNFSPCQASTSVTSSGGPALFTIEISGELDCGTTSYGAQADDVGFQISITDGAKSCSNGSGQDGLTYRLTADCTISAAPVGPYEVTVQAHMWPYDQPVPTDCQQYPPGYNTQYCMATHYYVQT